MPSKAVMYAELGNNDKPADNTQAVKQINFVDENGKHVDIGGGAAGGFTPDTSQHTTSIGIDGSGSIIYRPVGETGKAILAAADDDAVRSLLDFDAAARTAVHADPQFTALGTATNASGDAPTAAEFNALVEKVNAIVTALKTNSSSGN